MSQPVQVRLPCTHVVLVPAPLHMGAPAGWCGPVDCDVCGATFRLRSVGPFSWALADTEVNEPCPRCQQTADAGRGQRHCASPTCPWLVCLLCWACWAPGGSRWIERGRPG